MNKLNSNEVLLHIELPYTDQGQLLQVLRRQVPRTQSLRTWGLGEPGSQVVQLAPMWELHTEGGIERSIEKVRTLTPEDCAIIRLIAGEGVRYGMHHFIPASCKYITCLSFPDKAKSSSQLRALLGFHVTSNQEINKEHLDKAKSLISSDFLLVGIAERMLESMYLLHDALDWQDFSFWHSPLPNATIREDNILPHQTEQDLVEHNLDRELYEFALDKLENSLSGLSASKRQKIVKFRQLKATFDSENAETRWNPELLEWLLNRCKEEQQAKIVIVGLTNIDKLLSLLSRQNCFVSALFDVIAQNISKSVMGMTVEEVNQAAFSDADKVIVNSEEASKVEYFLKDFNLDSSKVLYSCPFPEHYRW